jgi:hypothetical protein
MDDDLVRLTNTAQGVLEQALGLTSLSAEEYAETEGYNFVALAGCTLERKPGKNWVEEEGGLPEYICEVARSIHQKRGKSISNAIQIAIGTIQRWARGQGDVNPDTRAKAAKALAQWEAMRARAKARPNK